MIMGNVVPLYPVAKSCDNRFCQIPS